MNEEEKSERHEMVKNYGEMEFTFKIFDLYSGVEKDLLNCIYSIAVFIGRPELKGPLFSMAYELAVNGLKSLYKRAYIKYFLEEIGMDSIPYEEWLQLFKTEIDEHQAENFAYVCRKNDIYVEVKCKVLDNVFHLEVINDGVPSKIEHNRLNKTLTRAKENTSASFILEEDFGDDGQKEGGGLGLTMIITTLRNMGIDTNNFQFKTEGDQTHVIIDIPLESLN